MWRVVFSKQAAKDAKKLSASGLEERTVRVLRMWTHYE